MAIQNASFLFDEYRNYLTNFFIQACYITIMPLLTKYFYFFFRWSQESKSPCRRQKQIYCQAWQSSSQWQLFPQYFTQRTRKVLCLSAPKVRKLTFHHHSIYALALDENCNFIWQNIKWDNGDRLFKDIKIYLFCSV